MNDLPLPETITPFPSSEAVGGLPTPKPLAELADDVSKAPIPLPLDRLMELAGTAGQTFPTPQPIDQLTNRS